MILFELRAIFYDPDGMNTCCIGYYTSLEFARSRISTLEKAQKSPAIPYQYLLIPHLLRGVSISDNRIYEKKVVFSSRLYSDSESCCLGVFQDKSKALYCAETFRKHLDPKFSKDLIYTVSVSEHTINNADGDMCNVAQGTEICVGRDAQTGTFFE